MANTSTTRTTCRLPRQGKRQCRHQERKTKDRPSIPNGYGFLRHRFLPMTGNGHEDLRDWRKVQKDFFTSIGYFCDLYGFSQTDVKHRIYPDNIRCAYQQVAAQLARVRPDLQLVILQEEHTIVATVKPINTGITLYYIPVRPIWELTQDNKRQQLANLLLSVYAYLYQVAVVPYYTESSSYLHNTYEMMEEWVNQDPEDFDTEDYTERISAFNSLKWYGSKILRRIRHPYALQQLEKRLHAFQPCCTEEQSLHQVCSGLLKLYNEYPDRSIFDNIREGWIDPKEEERIYPEQFISFYWDYKDCLYPSLFETVNYDLQEKSVSDEPLGMQLFDRPQEEVNTHELDFEQRFFELVNDLTALL